MARPRPKLLAMLRSGATTLGYHEVPGPARPALALFWKKSGDLSLALGIELSGHYRDRFTGSFYLSKSLAWSYVLSDFPRQAYARIGSFLTDADRGRLLDPEFCKPGVVDAWWIGFSPKSVTAFVKAVNLAEESFLAQPGLRKAIAASTSLSEHMDWLKKIGALAISLREQPANLACQPKSNPNDIPPPWFWAAEIVLRKSKPEWLTRDGVFLYAVDAWRCCSVGLL